MNNINLGRENIAQLIKKNQKLEGKYKLKSKEIEKV